MASREDDITARWAALLAGPDRAAAESAVVEELAALAPPAVAELVIELLTATQREVRERAQAHADLTTARRRFDVMDAQLRVLERERQKLSAVVGQSNTVIFLANRELAVPWSNAALKAAIAARNHGVSHLTVDDIWRTLSINCPPAGSPGCPLARAFGANAAVHAEVKQRLNGDRRDLYLSILPIREPDGSTAEVLVMVQDLSDLEVLRRSEARYRMIFDRSPDAMVMAEPTSGRILLTNSASAELTGYPRQQLTTMYLSDLYEPQDWPAARETCVRAVSEDSVIHVQQRLRTSAGEPIDVDITAARFDLDNRPVAFIVLQDFTERRRLESELRHSQKMEAVGRLAGGVAHEFNNIMTIILGQADLLSERANGDAGADAELREIADNTEKAAMRAAFLTRKLLAFSRKDVVRSELLDLNEVVNGIEGMLRHLLGERVTTHVELAPEPVVVRGDRAQLEQVLINLAANARDALRGGGEFGLTLSARKTPEVPPEVVLTARDDGVGMDAETRERLFEPFFTTKGPGEGTGLGMSTIYQVVETCGGRISVESSPGQGTRVEISLPWRQTAGATTTRPRPLANARGDERILLVDDDRNVRDSAARMLRLDGYDVTVAASASEALATVERATEPFHLLVTDVVMPGMTGGELAREVSRRSPTTRIVFVSGYADEEMVRLGVSRAEADFLQKPFSRISLGRKVRAVLDA